MLGPTGAGQCCCLRWCEHCASATSSPHLLSTTAAEYSVYLCAAPGQMGVHVPGPPRGAALLHPALLPATQVGGGEALHPALLGQGKQAVTGTTAAAVWCLAAGAALLPLLPGCRCWCWRCWRGAAAAAAAALGVTPPYVPAADMPPRSVLPTMPYTVHYSVQLLHPTLLPCRPMPGLPCSPLLATTSGQSSFCDSVPWLHSVLLLVAPCRCWFISAEWPGYALQCCLLPRLAVAGCRQTVAGSTAPHDCPMRWQLHQQGRSPPFNRSACTWPCCACRTHYFYRLLGASYTFPAHNLNQARPACLECHESAAQRLDPARSL